MSCQPSWQGTAHLLKNSCEALNLEMATSHAGDGELHALVGRLYCFSGNSSRSACFGFLNSNSILRRKILLYPFSFSVCEKNLAQVEQNEFMKVFLYLTENAKNTDKLILLYEIDLALLKNIP